MPTITLTHKVDTQTLVENPERILQEFSFQVFNRRVDMLNGMVGRTVVYRSSKQNQEPRSGELVKVDAAGNCTVRTPKGNARVDATRLLL